jgi:hypothetical protein
VDVLYEDEPKPGVSFQIQAHPEPLPAFQRMFVVEFGPGHHQVDIPPGKLGKIDPDSFQEPVPGMFQVILVNSVIDDALQIAFIVSHLELQGKMVIFISRHWLFSP